MKDFGKQSLELHKRFGGKLEVRSKVPLKNKDDLSVAYTPGVAEVCEVIAKDHSLAKQFTMKKNTIAVVTDGSAVLGLGNLGAEAALPVMEGKCILFKEFAGIDAVPICLNTQNTEEIIETIKNIAPTFGGINLEDISAPRCFEIEQRLRQELNIPIFHDDQWGTAVVLLAALINSLKLKNQTLAKTKIIINGAGAAGTAIVKLLVAFGAANILVCDSQGLIIKSRAGLDKYKLELVNLIGTDQPAQLLGQCLVGADVFIGVSVKKILTAEMVHTMNAQPIIFALANPEPEIQPEVAKQAGAFIAASGRSDCGNQLNNLLAFPGIFRGALDNNVSQITLDMLLQAAKNLSSVVTDLSVDKILPSPFEPLAHQAVARAIKN